MSTGICFTVFLLDLDEHGNLFYRISAGSRRARESVLPYFCWISMSTGICFTVFLLDLEEHGNLFYRISAGSR